MPKGIYYRSPEYLALLALRMAERRANGTCTSPVAHLHTPEIYAKRDAASRLARPPKEYPRQGTDDNCRFIHRMRAEKTLGKPLPIGAVVHHADGSKNPNATLVICQDNAYHMGLHLRMRIKAAGGHPWLDKMCCRCKQPKPKTEFYSDRYYPDGLSMKCKPCVAVMVRARRRRHQPGAV
jgi:hypothetical protein